MLATIVLNQEKWQGTQEAFKSLEIGTGTGLAIAALIVIFVVFLAVSWALHRK